MTGRSPRGRLYAGTARRAGPDAFEPDEAERPDADDPDEPEDALEPLLGALLPPLRDVAVPVDDAPDDRVRPCSLNRTGGWKASIEDDAGVDDDGPAQPELDVPLEPIDEPLPTLPPPPPPPPLGTAVPLPASLRGTALPVVLPLDVRSWADARPEIGRLATVNATATVKSLWRVITPPNRSDKLTGPH